MRKIVTILFVVFGIQVSASDINTHYDSLYIAGNTAYQNQKFDTALQFYSEILNSGLESFDLYYNIANAHYKLQQIPEAILFYEKSLKLAPNSPDVQYNLKLANKLIVDKIEPLPIPFYMEWKDSLINALLLDTWGFLSIGFMVASMIFLLLYFFTRNGSLKRISFYLFIVFLVGTGTTYYFAKEQAKQVYETKNAIIFATRTNVYSEPNTSSSVLFVIHSGLKVKVLKTQTQWLNIVLPDGSIGWVPEEVVQEI